MANMSYCRFHNTRLDLQDCFNALEEREIASEEEKQYAVRMFNNFLAFCESEGIIDGWNAENVEEIINECELED